MEDQIKTIFNNMLSFNTPLVVFLLVLIVLLQQSHQVSASEARPWLSSSSAIVAKPGCRDKCGNITIPYPFGIGRGCYFDKTFEITCNDTDNPSSTRIKSPSIYYAQVYDISMDSVSFGTTLLSFGPNKSSGKSYVGDEGFIGSLRDGYYSSSTTKNKFIVIGCDIYVYIKNSETGENIGGCASFCDNITSSANLSSCMGYNGCCKSTISGVPKRIAASIQTMNTRKAPWAFNNCSYMLIASDGFSNYKVSELLNVNSSNCRAKPTALARYVDEWVIGEMSCEHAMGTPKYACQKNSYCINAANYGYRCSCSSGYRGNPYLSNGCQAINECASPTGTQCPHDTRCFNTPGSYYCAPNHGRSRVVLQLCIGIAAAVIFIALVVACVLLHRQIKNRKERKAKEKFFKRNGGLLLQNRISTSEGSDTTPLQYMKLFQREELEKATNNFNESRILGKGGLGTVYKGMLSDGSIVAIKKSNVYVVDEDQVGQFVNEIFILSQINQRHIVKVLGCCLETQIPLLVYECISNGTLSHHLHGSSNNRPIPSDDSRTITVLHSLEHRLRIAREIAGALSYLHSWASSAIFHRDIKSSNILLDDNYRAVVSDFGLSRLVPIEKTHLTTTVGGTFGYLDPEYFRSGHLNDKSDVYAFGVVLLELLTSQKAVCFDASSDGQSLAMRFISMFKQDRLLEIVDTEIARDVEGQEMVPIVAKLAKRCLKSNARKRPSMKEVAAELDQLRMTRYDMPHAEIVSPNSESLSIHTSDSFLEDN